MCSHEASSTLGPRTPSRSLRRTLCLHAAGELAGSPEHRHVEYQEPRSRHDHPPKQRSSPASDLWAESFARWAGVPIFPNVPGGPKHKIWGRRPPASWQVGRRGAATGFAQPVMAQRWTCIEHGRPRSLGRGRSQPTRSWLLLCSCSSPLGSKIPRSETFRSTNTPVPDRPTT